MENQPYFLTESEDLSSIFIPLKTTSRIKYTCFNASKSFLIFGATSGGLYVFRREPCCFLQLLPNKEGAVTQVSISPNEKLIAFSTIRGIICILEKTSHGAKHLVTAAEHQNEQITSLQWNGANNELFVGDSAGKVSIVMITIFPTKGMFQTPSFVLMQLDSKIVQMDFSSNMLLVSTLTKCYICDTKKEIFRQVGHKLRDGEYGACIINTQTQNEVDLYSEKSSSSSSETPDLSSLKLFCARPGSRVWECAIDGTVISTHHFKEALAVPPRKIYFLSDLTSQNGDLNGSVLLKSNGPSTEQINSNFSEQSFNFSKLYVLTSKFFFTFKSDGIYIFDPQRSVVVLWNNEITNILDAKSADDVMYVWSGSGKVYALNLISLEKFLIRLYFQKKYFQLAKLCLEHRSFLMAKATLNEVDGKLHVLHDLDEKLKCDENLIGFGDELKPLIGAYKEMAARKGKSVRLGQKLKSDIYSVNNCQIRISDGKRSINGKILTPLYLNLKGRSHSVSPERFQNGDFNNHRGSSSSLPDLMKEEVEEKNKREGNREREAEEEEEEEENFGVRMVGRRKRKEEENNWPNVEKSILKICELIKNSSNELSKDLVFNFFDNILPSGEPERDGSFPFEIHFDQIEMNLISDSFHFCLKSNFFLDWLTKFEGDRPKDRVENYPRILMANHAIESLKMDFKLSRLLKFFSSLLKENEIIELIRELEMDCYYHSLLEILNVYRETSLTSVSEATLNLANVSSGPKILNIVHFLIGVGQVERCSKYSGKINLKEFFYLMLKFSEESKKSGKPIELIDLQCQTLFLTYLEKTSRQEELIGGCDGVVENYVIDCLENINSTATCSRESNCDCGFPLNLVHPSMAMFPDVGHALIRKTWPENMAKSMEICGRIPYLWSHLIFVRRKEPLDSVLPLILQSGEIQELENRSTEIDLSLLESCLDHLIRLKGGNCLNCNGKIDSENVETVSWTEFGLICIKFLGPEDTLELLGKRSEEIDSKELNQIFFQSLIFSSIMEKHGKGPRRNVVNFLAGKGGEESNRISVFSESVKRRIFGENFPRGNYHRPKESISHHWGVKVNFKDNCPVCSLPLDTKVLISETGLIVFKCGHAFHSACLPKVNLECPVCKSESSREEN